MKIGIVDSGGPTDVMIGACSFQLIDDHIVIEEAIEDHIGHGSLIDNVIRASVPSAMILHAQVFKERPVTTALQVSSAILWLLEQEVDVICLSLGLPKDRAVLKNACDQAQAQGTILVSSTPAQGIQAFPAAYDNVIAATGDARCQQDQISHLSQQGMDVFGAWCASPEHTGQRAGGASIGCARLVGHIATLLQDRARLSVDQIKAFLIERSQYKGREYRQPRHA